MSISQERTEQVLKMFTSEGFNLCGCLGAINGQPHCPCKMARLAKEEAERCHIYEHDPLEATSPDKQALTTELTCNSPQQCKHEQVCQKYKNNVVSGWVVVSVE